MLYQVDPKLHIITFGGVPLVGFAEDKITLSKIENTFSSMVGCGGETTRIRSNNNNWTGKLSFLPGSPSLDYLSNVALRDEVSNSGVLPFTCKDILGTTKFFAAQAYIEKPADFASGKTIKILDWNIVLISVQWHIGGNI